MTRIPIRIMIAFAGALALVVIGANIAAMKWRVHAMKPPDYGVWSGMMEVEHKLRLLESFAREGPVDALIVSSSMGDHGVSAETMTHALSAHLGRPFRVFNFGIGGAGLPTYAEVYRLARLVAKPNQVWIVSHISMPRDEIIPRSLDEQLLDGPLARYRTVPGILALSRWFYELPLIRYAPAARDLLVQGKFARRPATNLDLYDINAYGDTVSWVYYVEESNWRDEEARATAEVLEIVKDREAALRRAGTASYFNPRTTNGIARMRDDTRRDGVGLTLIAFEHAMALTRRDAGFVAASHRYFEVLARELGASLVDARQDLEVRSYMIADPTHLNTIGSREVSRIFAARMRGAAPPPAVHYEAWEGIGDLKPDKSWTRLTALVPKSATSPSTTMELRYLQNWGVAPLREGADVHVAVRLPSGIDTVVPAEVAAPGIVMADVSGLPLAGRDVVLRTQLVPGSGAAGDPLMLPLADVRWSAKSYSESRQR